jgi:deoxycytidylate deaminase
MMPTIPTGKRLEPYFKIAEFEAHKSPCTRRQYGALITIPSTTDILYDVSFNKRISPCCNGGCVRDRVNTRHGGSVEIGGEIHAETSLLIETSHKGEGYFILVGFENGHQLTNSNVYPCHSCAMALKFAGYNHIYIRDKNMTIIPVSVSDIIEYRMGEWEPE